MAMTKRSTFTTISPLPLGVTREFVISFLHNHAEMIDLNPLIIERHQIDPPPHATEEERRCVWWSMTDKISYLPGGVVTGVVTYTAAFNDLPTGVQTHSYAPMGTDILGRWSLHGSLPGEPPEPVELGTNAPRQGLYLREDVEIRCNILMTSFVKKTLKKAHGTLVDRLLEKASATGPGQGAGHYRQPTASSIHSGSTHSNHSSTGHATYPTPGVSQQHAAPYQQHHRQQSSKPESATNSYGHATPPPPGTSSPYRHNHSPAPSAGSNSFIPEPLRVNKKRTPSGGGGGTGMGLSHPQQVQTTVWSNGRSGSGQRVPRTDDGGFRAELE